MKNLLFIVIAVFLTISCENLIVKDLELDETGYEKQLVVFSNLEGEGDSIRALISENVSILENYEDIVYIDNANVRLLRDGIEVGKLNQSADGFYYHFFDKPLTTTGEYELVVSDTKYGEARSKTILPENAVISDLKFKLNAGSDPLEMTQVSEISFTIKDKPGKNYYSIEVLSESLGFDTFIYNEDTSIYAQEIYAYPTTTQLDPALISSGYSDKVYISDDSFDGKSYKVSVRYVIWGNGGSHVNDELKDILQIKFVSHSEDSFNYTTSFDRYQQSTDFGIFSEPVSVYTNIENGLGVFAGSNSKIYKFVE